MKKENVFSRVIPGDIVLIDNNCLDEGVDSWQGLVIHVTSSARDPNTNSIFQVICIHTGTVRTVNADLIKKIIIRSNESQDRMSGYGCSAIKEQIRE